MTVSFALFRKAVRDPGFRTVVGGKPSSPPITPIGTFRKAICTYHRFGKTAAFSGIALKSTYWRTNPRGKSLARNYRDSLAMYFALDARDGRRSYDVGVREQIIVSGQALTVYMDALVYDRADHGARVALWDVPQPSAHEAAVMAWPVMAALEAAVGLQRAHSVAFWHLRTGTVIEVDNLTAKVEAADAADAVLRAAGV